MVYSEFTCPRCDHKFDHESALYDDENGLHLEDDLAKCPSCGELFKVAVETPLYAFKTHLEYIPYEEIGAYWIEYEDQLKRNE